MLHRSIYFEPNPIKHKALNRVGSTLVAAFDNMGACLFVQQTLRWAIGINYIPDTIN